MIPMRQSHFFPSLVVCAGLVLCPSLSAQADPARALGVDTTGFDRSARPQDDFDRFVNGRWADRTEIPADRSGWGSFNELDERTQAALRVIVEDAAAKRSPAGSERQKVGDLYASYMDSAAIERRGIQPLAAELAAIADVKGHAGLPAAMARLQKIGVSALFSGRVQQDPKQSSVYIVSVGQVDVPLGDRNFYLLESDAFKKIRGAYVEYLTKLFTLASVPDPAGAAGRVLAFETAVAGVQWDRVRNRDREAVYNPMPVEGLAKLMPSFSWYGYLGAAGMGGVRDVVVRQPDYLQAMEKVVASTPIATWREFLTARLLDDYANQLPNAFAEARFELRGRALSGQQQRPPRWKRGVAEVETNMGEALGKLYVEKNFPPDAKARMDALVRNLRSAFHAGIGDLEWMGPATREQARAKLSKFTVKIGYPDRWEDYAEVDVRRDDLLGNVMRARTFQFADAVSQLGRPVDRTKWGMTPQTVNAYYNSSNNEIVFPAAILQPPFFNVAADDAVNYGAIGAVIGHEISHGFDDQGRKSDGEGNLREWWTADDERAFEQRADRLVKQFDAYVPVDTLHVNGRQTLGENIGDLSGLAVAYRAYRMSLGGREAPVIAGFTGDQRFFLGWAQIWRTKTRPERARQLLLTDTHAPGSIRAFAPLTNFEPFYRAFDLQEGDKLYRAPGERVKVW
jgi:putative endopeptidase